MLPFHRGPCRVSIHRQILLIASAPALIVTFLLVFVVYQNNIHINRQLLEQQGRLLAAQIAGALEYALATGERDQLASVVGAAVKPAADILGTPVREVVVTDQNGRRLYAQADPAPAAPTGAEMAEVAPADRAVTRFSMPIMLQPLALNAGAIPPSRPLGQVTVDLALNRAQARWRQRLLWDLGWVFLTFAASAGLAYWVGRRISSAIRRIAGAIQSIKNGDLATRLPQTDINELGTLQEGVNLLADTIQRGRERLEAELAKVRGEYRETLRALEQANEAKSLFLAKISHEMRTPMYSVLGSLEQLLKHPSEPSHQQTLATVQEAAKALNRHIENILDVTHLAQMEKEGQRLPCDEAVSPWAELEAETALQEPLMIARMLYLDLIVAPNVPAVVKSNIKGVQEIFANLIGNAVKYTQAGGIVIWLETVRRPVRDPAGFQFVLRLRVADTGCGIPENRLDSIFREFEQVDEAYSRRYGGTGLGLSFVKKNCALLGGHVTVASTPDVGSTFTVELPYQPADALPSNRPLAGERPLPTHWRALVTDERASFRASVMSRLAGLDVAAEEQAISLTALAGARPCGPRYTLLVVQDVGALEEADLQSIVEGLHRWAETVVALETDYSAAAVQRLRRADVDLVLWSGVNRAKWRAALERHYQDEGGDEHWEAAEKSAAADSLEGRTVLVVEDFDVNRAIMVKQLQENGARVLEAADGDTAVAMASEPGLDLILMDIQMPIKDGMTAIQDIRRLSCGARLPILGFTASADKPTHQRILRAGADRVLTKPISQAKLVGAVAQAIQQAAAGPWLSRR